jgi:hypothetical protein
MFVLRFSFASNEIQHRVYERNREKPLYFTPTRRIRRNNFRGYPIVPQRPSQSHLFSKKVSDILQPLEFPKPMISIP